MNKFWLAFGLMGCIAPNASLQTSDSGDIGLVDTDNTEDTSISDTDDTQDDTEDTSDTDDAQDTEDTSVDEIELTQDGLFAMRNQYLLMDGSIGLRLQLELNNQGDPIQNQKLANFLRDDFDWGMGISMGAYNEDTFLTQFLDQRLSLVRANGALLSLKWMQIGMTDEFRPLIYLNRFDNLGSLTLCAESVFGSQSDTVEITEEVLRAGYHLMITHDASSETITVYIYTQQNGEGHFAELFSSTPPRTNDCSMDNIFEDSIVFGQGLSVLSSSASLEALNIPDLRARIDDVFLFNGVGGQALLSLPASERLNTLSGLYLDEDGSTDLWAGNANEDGWYWYPVDPSPPHIQNGVYQQLWDETVVLGNYNYTLEIVGDDGAVKSSEEALEYYYDGNNSWSPE